ncbi:MAG: hypothetical protein IJA82_06005 [Clostridia bacterium]|nr:hypothetical protein [Clostridia bacterium]
MSNDKKKSTLIVPKFTKNGKSVKKSQDNDTEKKPKKKNSPLKKAFAIILGLLCIGALVFFIVYSVTREKPPKYDEKYVYDGNSLVGSWREYYWEDKFYQIFEFTSDGKINLKSYTYGIFDQELSGTYETSGTNTITITYGDNKETSNFSIDEGGSLVLYTLGDMGFVERPLVKNDIEYNKNASKIFGTWVSNANENEEFEFFDTFIGEARNVTNPTLKDNFRYSLSGNKMYMLYVIIFEDTPDITSGDVLCFDYSIEGDTLTIFGYDSNSKKIEQVFTRKK